MRLRVIDAPRRTKTLASRKSIMRAAQMEQKVWNKDRVGRDGGTNEWIDGHGHYVVTRVLKWSTLNILIVLYPASWSHLCFHETVSHSRHRAFSIIAWEDHLGIPLWLIHTIKRIVNLLALLSPLILHSIIHPYFYSSIKRKKKELANRSFVRAQIKRVFVCWTILDSRFEKISNWIKFHRSFFF